MSELYIESGPGEPHPDDENTLRLFQLLIEAMGDLGDEGANSIDKLREEALERFGPKKPKKAV